MRQALLRYGAALLLVGAALLVSLLVQPYVSDAFLVLFVAAVMLSGWFGRTGPGLFSVVLSVLAVDYYFIAPARAFVMDVEEIPYFLSFLLCSVLASWLSSARSLAEERQKAHLDELFQQAPEAIMLVDLRDRVLRVNREFSRIFQYTADEVVTGLSTAFIVPEELRQQAIASRKQLVRGEHVSLETIRRRKDGSLLHVSEMAFPVIVGGQQIAHYVIIRDISETRHAAEALQKAQADLAHLSRVTTMGELTASIAHEVNQPIAAVVTNGNAAMRWLAKQPPNLDEVREALSWIIRDANRAGAVIGRIRSLVKKTAAQMTPLNINELIHGVLVLTNNEIKRENIVVKTDLGDLPEVIGDRVQLQQVILNLIINSIEAMADITDRRRELQINSSSDNDCVLIQVQDSGPGWKAEHGDSMFDAFFTTKTNGMGMGLAISRSIIEAHGGRLWATLASPHGAVLNFTIPITGNAS
jgi:PAS domain S-box-containing protein